jgi:hypothetical protein
MSATRPKVFLSYSHWDQRWAGPLLTHLRAIADNVDVWSDAEIRPGENWTAEVTRAVSSADVAILLVSAAYLASKFIVREELPAILESASQGRTQVLPVMVSPAFYEASPLSKLQFVNNPNRPLSSMNSIEQEQVFTELARVIQQRLPELARPTRPDRMATDTVAQLAPLVDEIAARVVQRLAANMSGQGGSPYETRPTAENNLVFAAMPFSDDMEPVFEGIAAAANSVGLEAKRVQDVPGDYRITDKIMGMILSSQMVVVDLTHERPNVYFELGYARASGKTVITIAHQGTTIHFDVKDWTYIPYFDSRTLERDLRERFSNELRR